MTDSNDQDRGDSIADAIAAVAVVTIIVVAVVYWLTTV